MACAAPRLHRGDREEGLLPREKLGAIALRRMEQMKAPPNHIAMSRQGLPDGIELVKACTQGAVRQGRHARFTRRRSARASLDPGGHILRMSPRS